MPLSSIAAAVAMCCAQSRAGPSTNEDSSVELLLLDVLYDHLRVDTALTALQDTKGHRYIALRQLAAALGFRLRVDAAKLTAQGFLNDPSDRFDLNAGSGTCWRKGQLRTFDPTLCFARENELFVDAEILSKIAGLHFAWQLNRLQLDVSSDSPLPVQRQWMQRYKLDSDSAAPKGPLLPLVRSPYAPWSLPSVDLQWFTDARVENTQFDTASRLQVEGRGDLLFMSARYRYISASADHPATTLLTLGREDPAGSLFGSMHATQFAVGDLNVPQIPLFARARNGVGASISNFPVAGFHSGDPTVIDGHAAPGAIVELYRQNELLTTTRPDSEGHFVFPSVALENGPNDLRIVSVTPDGDVHEERRTVYGAAGGPDPGKSLYRFTLARVGNSLLPSGLDGIPEQNRRLEAISEYRFGISESTWLSTVAAQTNGSAGSTGYVGAGLHSWTGKNLWHLDALGSQNGGAAAVLGLVRRFGRNTVSIEHTIASPRFGSDMVPELGSSATSMTKLRMDGSTGNSRHPLSYGLDVDRYDGSAPATQIRGRVSGSDGKTFFANTVAARIGNGKLDAAGLLQVHRPFGSALGRFDLGYSLGGGDPLRTVRLSFDRNISSDYRLRFGLDYDAVRLSRFETSGAIFRMFGAVGIGLNLAVDPRGAMRANILLSVGSEADEALHTLALARAGAAATGTVAVHVYLDQNANGRFDDGDVSLPNVGVNISGHPALSKTDKNGRCFIDRLPTMQETPVTLNVDSFEDPSWTPETPGALVLARAGRVAHLEFAVVEAAEIEGKGEGLRDGTGVTAELVDRAGAVRQSSVLDLDRTFVFSRVLPGAYILRLMDADGNMVASRTIQVRAGDQLRGITISTRSR